MNIKFFRAKRLWFLGFTAVYVVMVGMVFWGAWSSDFSFVQPDSPTVPSPYAIPDFWRGWLANGRFCPHNLLMYIGPCRSHAPFFYSMCGYLSGLALMYYLRGRGLSRLASYGAGLFLGLCGYWFSLFSAGHGTWFLTAAYVLWPFGLLDRAIRKGKIKNWILTGATLAWAAYWQTDLWLLFTVFIGAYFVYKCVVERTFPWKGMLIACVSLFAIGGAAFRSAICVNLADRDAAIAEGATLSAKDKASTDAREKRWIFVTNWSLPPTESAEFFIPRINGDTSCPLTLSLGTRYGTGVKPYTGALGRPKDAPSGNYRQHSLYVGLVTCLLALCGIVFFCASLKSGKDSAFPLLGRDILFFAVAAILFWLCSMGRYCEPVYRVVFALPFGDYLRAPVKWHHLTEFCLCVLAGYGIEGLLGRLGRLGRFGRFAPWILGAVVLIGAIDLARIDHLYCAPVDLREAKRQNCNMQMTFLRKADFSNPQVAAMVKAKKIVALAQPNPETYLVGILNPWKKNTDPLPPMGTAAWLGVLSMLGTLAAGVYATWGECCPRSRS